MPRSTAAPLQGSPSHCICQSRLTPSLVCVSTRVSASSPGPALPVYTRVHLVNGCGSGKCISPRASSTEARNSLSSRGRPSLCAVWGHANALAYRRNRFRRPLTIWTCCRTAPIHSTDRTSGPGRGEGEHPTALWLNVALLLLSIRRLTLILRQILQLGS